MVKNYRVKNSHSGIKQKLRQWLVMIGMVMIGVGYAGEANAVYTPTGLKENTFTEILEYGKVFDFSNVGSGSGRITSDGDKFDDFMAKVKTVDCPDYIAVCMMTWANNGGDDDYDMQYVDFSLFYGSERYSLCSIDHF